MSDWTLYVLLAQMLGKANLEHSVLKANDEACWPDLLSLSSHQMVTTQLYWILKASPDIWHKVDGDSQNYLQHIFALNGERNVQLLEETREIIGALNQQEITPLLLKGTGQLLSEECPDIAYRMQLDIDFLVLPEELKKAAETIQHMGYCYAEETKTGLEIAAKERILRLLKIYEEHKHLPPLLNPGKRVLVELHRHPYSKRFQRQVPVNNIFERAIIKSRNGLNWLEMSAKDQEYLLLIEGYIDPGFKRAFQLPLRLGRDFLDIQALLSKESANQEIELSEHLITKQAFPKALIEGLFTATDKTSLKQEVISYLQSMERVMENQLLHKAIDLQANLIRRSINLFHNPGLIRRFF